MDFYRIMMGPGPVTIPSIGEKNALHYIFGHTTLDQLLKSSPEIYIHPLDHSLTVAYGHSYSILNHVEKNKVARSDNIRSWTVNHARVRLGELKANGSSFKVIGEPTPRRLLASCNGYFGPGDIVSKLHPLTLGMIRSKAGYVGKDFKARLPTHLLFRRGP